MTYLLFIIIFAVIGIIIAYIYKNKIFYEKNKNIKIDDIEIIKRTPEYEKLIEKLINDKKQLFTKEEIDIMKNKFQYYNTEYGIYNITDEILNTFKNNDFNKNNDNQNDIYIEETINENPAYNSILYNIGNKHLSTCNDIEVLKNKEYLKNYYYDMNANKIKSELKDYINDYQIQIDNDNNISQKVDIVKTNTGFIIPDQYPTLKYQTNAYNIDWSRIQNPLTIY